MPSQLKSHDELSSIDSEIKIEQLLNDIKKLIDECKSEHDLKRIAQDNPHLVPIMISHYGSAITKSLIQCHWVIFLILIMTLYYFSLILQYGKSLRLMIKLSFISTLIYPH